MTPNKRQAAKSAAVDYLCVDSFIKSVVDARALATALELGFIDHLVRNPSSTPEELRGGMGCDDRGAGLLLNLLRANGVVGTRGDKIALTPEFMKALEYRDLLEAKLAFANLAALDFVELFSVMIRAPQHFLGRARIFEFFGYNRCYEPSERNLEMTRRWMRITTALTKYEAAVCMDQHDFGLHRRMLDVGGNSGEFALRVCRENPAVIATVFDLPLVCDIGREHVASEPEAERITFVRGDALSDALPRGFDLVTFKSMLHDWPDETAKGLIAKASESLEAGGTLLIFERGPIEVSESSIPYSIIPFLLFFRSFRSPRLYEEQLLDQGFEDVVVRRIPLETPFNLVTARKGG